MIILDNVTMTVPRLVGSSKMTTQTVLSEASVVIPTDRRIALLGPSNENKKNFINLLGGLGLPRSGHIFRKANVSFPVGHLGGFVSELPVRINIEHIARLYNLDVHTIVEFVRNTAQIGRAFDEPFAALPAASRKQIGYIIAFAIPFDTYVLINQIPPGRKARDSVPFQLFEERAKTAGMIIPTQSPNFALRNCEMALVLRFGKLRLFDDVKQALLACQLIKPSRLRQHARLPGAPAHVGIRKKQKTS